MSEKNYIIDANVLIEAKNNYYAFDVAPKIWQLLKEAIISGRIILIDKVKNEIMQGNDELAEWCGDLPKECIICTENQGIVKNYGQVLEHIQQSGYYKDSALELWAQEKVADPWIIAVALSTKFSVITTHEKGKITLSTQSPSKEAKIPNVAQHFGISVCTLIDVFRDLHIIIG